MELVVSAGSESPGRLSSDSIHPSSHSIHQNSTSNLIHVTHITHVHENNMTDPEENNTRKLLDPSELGTKE